MQQLLLSIKQMECAHKQNSTPLLLDKINHARNDLTLFLMSQHHRWVKYTQSNKYHYGNKAGKLLSQQLQNKVVKQKMSHSFHPNSDKKLLNPQEIVDTFSSYYG